MKFVCFPIFALFQEIYSLFVGNTTFPRLPMHYFMGLNVVHFTLTQSNLSAVSTGALDSLDRVRVSAYKKYK
jgi:hypothetical protein